MSQMQDETGCTNLTYKPSPCCDTLQVTLRIGTQVAKQQHSACAHHLLSFARAVGANAFLI
jgi:hypothetical protein